MDRDAAKDKLKQLLVDELNLDPDTAAGIDETAPLLRVGLELNSLDALQLALAVEDQFGVRLPEGEDARPVFASLDALVDYVVRSRTDPL